MQSISKSNHPKSIAFISGKGGSGKSAVCIDLAYILADIGFRVGIVDCDISTHGITYFFVDQIGKNNFSFLDPITDSSISRIPFGNHSQEKYVYFIPSVNNLSTTIDKVPEDHQIAYAIQSINDKLSNLSCDFILYDCQAGFTTSSQQILKMSDYGIIVTEADPLSIWAVNSLYKQMELSQCIPGKLFGIVNKVMHGEENYYNAIVDITRQISFLKPLPFDRAVRRAFFRREIPIDTENPNAFVVGLFESVEKIDERIALKLSEVKNSKLKNKISESELELSNLEKLLEEVEQKLLETQRVQYKALFTRRSLIWASSLVYVILGTIFGVYGILPLEWSIAIALIGLLAAIFLLVIPNSWQKSSKDIKIKSEINKLEKMEQSLQEKIAELEIVKRSKL